MKPFAFLLAQLASTFLVASTLAQETTWQPARFPSFDFRDVAAAKIYENDNGFAVLGLISPTTKTRIVSISKTRTETKMRTVIDSETGETREQMYTVQVPYTEQVEQTYLGRRRVEVPIEHAKVWTFGGQALSNEEARKVLSSSRRCFYIATQDREYNYEGDSFYGEMLKPDVLVIWYDKTKATEPLSGEPPQPKPKAPRAKEQRNTAPPVPARRQG